jgi:formylglycine-generating enzyme required for sulfatase activity/dienelactone hydrolase
MSFVSELKRRKVFRVAAAYIVSAWLIIQVVETIFPAFGFDVAAFRTLVVILAIGFVPAVILAWAFELTKSGLRPDRGASTDVAEDDTLTVGAVLRQPRFAIPLLLAFLVAGGAIVNLSLQLSSSREARLELIPQVEALLADDDIRGAYTVALAAEQVLPDDPVLERLWSTLAVRMSFVTEPAGAEVYYRHYGDGADNWELLGATPLENLRLPRTVLHWRFEKQGYETAERATGAFDGTYRVELVEGTLEEDMVAIPAGQRNFLLTGYARDMYEVPAFHAARFEVTNEAYSDFVRSGGYEDATYWSDLEFVRDGATLTWEEAVDTFRDATGRFGPSTWEGGTYREGNGQHPVSGISWYEAVAYAKYRDKQLPTIYQWSLMTAFPDYNEIKRAPGAFPGYGLFRSMMVALSNFSDGGPAAVGSHPGAGPFGTFDAAGNVREWCWNATDDAGERYILGGSSEDPNYLHTYGVAESPWDRSARNGVRLVSYDTSNELTAKLREPKALPATERLEPVTNEVFQVYRDLFDYDRTPLNAQVEMNPRDATHWTRETVSFDATYGDERVIAHVFLPKNIEPPYQVVVYYPGSNAILSQTSDELQLVFTDFIIKSGRAVVYPVLWATYERNIGLDTTWPKPTREYSNNVVRWIQDFRRTVDYLETRSDMDLDRLGYYGFSWGGWNGPMVLALDDRFKTGVFVSGGIPPTLARPEASSASYASRVTQPVLMISGEADVIRPVETYQAPMFESLGTSDNLKRHAILSGGHLPSVAETIAETLAWYDLYLGPVE